jgi:hypothetical protein
MENSKDTRDGILTVMLDGHPKPRWWKKGLWFPGSGCFCVEGGCDCPLAPLSAIKNLVHLGLVRINHENGYVLTEPKGVKAAVQAWNRYCLKDGKKNLMKAVPA